MKFSTLLVLLSILVAHLVGVAAASYDNERKASSQISRWQKHSNRYVHQALRNRTYGCTKDEIVYRQEWGSLSKETRIDYINAVKCLREKSPVTSTSEAPGVRSRFDDFVVSHIKYAPNIHFCGNFFFWHRYVLKLYEQALQSECSYKGTQPYWDWTLHWEDPSKSAVFDGSETSLGGNGKYVPHSALNVSAFGFFANVPAATGGGCVYSGPFANATVNMGPIAFNAFGKTGLEYNPRCLTRDISTYWSNFTKPSDVVNLISHADSLEQLGTRVGFKGVHTAGHFSFGGDPGSDPYSSPGDPVFFLHHATVDRVWTLWQNLDPGNRLRQIYGTNTAFNNPPSANVTLDSKLQYGTLSPEQTLGDMVSTIDGPFCYEYI